MPVPQHVAIIMDGNGRWAKARQLPRTAGHLAGVKTVRRITEHAAVHNIPYLSLFAFGKENWRRPKDEVGALMSLFISSMRKYIDEMCDKGVRLKIVGDLSELSCKLQKQIDYAHRITANNQRITLIIVLNYSGRWDIVQAANQLKLSDTCITEKRLATKLCLNEFPDPDLVIRTSGEQRLSNYMLWQTAYSEFYFCEPHWPAFDEAAFDAAIAAYQQRERRFGHISEQISHA